MFIFISFMRCNKHLIICYFSICIYIPSISMNGKKIIYFDENEEAKIQKAHRRKQSVNKSNNSISKGLRDSSATKQPKGSFSSRTNLTDKGGNSQKIRILQTKEGFMFEKKYMIYDIQCSLYKSTSPTSAPRPTHNPQPHPSVPQPDNSNNKTQQDYIFLSLQASIVGITKGQVRQNFAIQKDNCNFIEIRTNGYILDNLIIPNKRVQFIQFQGNQINWDELQITVVEPVKLIEGSQGFRENKIKEYWEKRKNNDGRNVSKSLNICWNLQTTQNAQASYRTHKKSEHQISGLGLNLYTSVTPNSQQRQTSKSKRINSSLIENMHTRGHKPQLSQFTRPKERSSANQNNNSYGSVSGVRVKTGSKISVSQIPGLMSQLGKVYGKQNSKGQDAYGLEDLGKKGRVRTITQGDPRQFESSYEMEIGKYGFGKKNM